MTTPPRRQPGATVAPSHADATDGRTPRPMGVACRVCGADAGADHVEIREMMFGSRRAFGYRRCHACGSLSIDRIPDDLASWYPHDYYAFSASPSISQDPIWRRAAIRSLVGQRLFGTHGLGWSVARRIATIPTELREISPLLQDAGLTSFDDPILDVGCGAMPVRLATLRKLGFRRLTGVEPFIPRSTTFQGVPVRKGYLGDIPGRYRLIMFHHSLEHVLDPLESMLQTADRLAPDGRCIVRTPIADGELWRRYGTDWVELDAPRHTVVFSLVGLRRLAARAGLEVVRVTWDSGHWEFIASEQYRRDIGMFEPGSWFEDESGSMFDDAAIEGFRAEARRLNAAGDAGRAAVWLRHAAGGGEAAEP
ncbi:MAG TPA: class I SAM-dependent methyltransferase [Candidatus Limnocylindrales bacterium]